MSDRNKLADEVIQANRQQSASMPAVVPIRSEQLIGNGRELLIEHAGETYRLRITRSGKLILTK